MQMKDKKIEAVKNWPKPKSMRDIQVFLGFANFYWHIIKGLSKIAWPFNSMLRTAWSTKNSLLSMAKDNEVGSFDGCDCVD